jgi:predicted cobalt transporter CbtA
VAATILGRRLTARLGAWNATLVGGATFIVAVVLGALALPTVNEVPEGFPAAVLWNFRIASLGIQLVMWTTMGLLLGALVHRRLAGAAQPEASVGAVAHAH